MPSRNAERTERRHQVRLDLDADRRRGRDEVYDRRGAANARADIDEHVVLAHARQLDHPEDRVDGSRQVRNAPARKDGSVVVGDGFEFE
jgi:hypothetical protein